MINKNRSGRGRKNGFTLVELLAVIVILAIILVIAVPKVMSVIEDSKKATFEASAKMIASSAETAYATNILLGNNKELKCSDVAKINSNDYESCTIKVDNGKPIVTIIGKGKFEGMSVCEGTKTSATVTSDCYTDASCFTTADYANYEVNNVEKCETWIGDLTGDDEYKILCHGEMIEGMTFNDLIAEGLLYEMLTIEELIEDEIIYEPEELGVSITGYSDTCEKDVVIPNEINGKPVMAISTAMSEEVMSFVQKGITSVVIPNTVESIGVQAFYGNKLKTINLPSNLKSIGQLAFYVNEFEGILDMSNLVNMKNLPVYAFTNVSMGNGKKLNEYGFSEIKLPSNIEEIGIGAFAGNNIEALDLSPYTKLKTIGASAFVYNEINDLTLSTNIEVIDRSAFAGNNIEALDLSSYTNLKTIGEFAFAINSIKTINIPTSIIAIGGGSFNDNELDDTNAYIYKRTDTNNDGIAEIDTTAVISYGGKNKNITLPSTITTIEDTAFNSCNLQSVIIPEGVTSIGNSAFSSNNLTEITIPNSVTTIEGSAFRNNNLQTVTIGTGVTSIEDSAFYKGENYTENTISNNNLTSIINKTGRVFDWKSIVRSYGYETGEYTFEIGTIENNYGNVIVSAN